MAVMHDDDYCDTCGGSLIPDGFGHGFHVYNCPKGLMAQRYPRNPDTQYTFIWQDEIATPAELGTWTRISRGRVP